MGWPTFLRQSFCLESKNTEPFFRPTSLEIRNSYTCHRLRRNFPECRFLLDPYKFNLLRGAPFFCLTASILCDPRGASRRTRGTGPRRPSSSPTRPPSGWNSRAERTQGAAGKKPPSSLSRSSRRGRSCLSGPWFLPETTASSTAWRGSTPSRGLRRRETSPGGPSTAPACTTPGSSTPGRRRGRRPPSRSS